MNGRILVATDLDPAASPVLAAAVAPFMGAGRTLSLCHVRFEPERFLAPGERAEQRAALDDDGTRRLEEWSASFLPELPRELLVEPAPVPSVGIERVAERWSADLIVVAASHASRLWRALTPGVDDLMVRRAHANVLVARPSPGSGVVLAGTDLSDPSFAAIAAAAHEAQRRDAGLVVVHSIDGASAAALYSAGGHPPALEARISAEQWVNHAMARTGSRGVVEIVEGAAKRVIVDRAAALGAALVVVSSHGGGGRARHLLGSVAEHLTHAAPCSVLVVRPADVPG